MNTELRPGIMALIIGAVKNPKVIGKIVEVGREVPDSYKSKYGHGYFVSSIEPLTWCLSKNLMPIKPESDPLNTKEEQHASS